MRSDERPSNTIQEGRLRDVKYVDTKGRTNNLNELVEQLKPNTKNTIFSFHVEINPSLKEGRGSRKWYPAQYGKYTLAGLWLD